MKVLSFSEFLRHHNELPATQVERDYVSYLAGQPNATEGARKAIVRRFAALTMPNGTSMSLHVGDEYRYDGEYTAPKVGWQPSERMIILHKRGYIPFAVNETFVKIVQMEEGESI